MTHHLHSYLDDIEIAATTEEIVDNEVQEILSERLVDIEKEIDSIPSSGISELNTKLDKVISLLEMLLQANSLSKPSSQETDHQSQK